MSFCDIKLVMGKFKAFKMIIRFWNSARPHLCHLIQFLIVNGIQIIVCTLSPCVVIMVYVLISILGLVLSLSLIVCLCPGKTKYRTGKDHYCWSQRKSRPFLKTQKYFCVLINKLDFHGTNGSPSLPICIQYSLLCQSCY